MSDTPDTIIPPGADEPSTSTPPPAGPPPRKRGRPPKDRSSEPARGPGRPNNHTTRAARVAALYAQLGSGLSMGAVFGGARLLLVGEAMIGAADELGEAWATWADTSPRVARLIDSLSFGGGAIAVLLGHAPIFRALIEPVSADDLGPLAGLMGLFTPAAAPEPGPVVDVP